MAQIPEEQIEALKTLADSLEDADLAVPDQLTRYVLRRAGFECRDERTVRLAGLAAQRFIASVLEDSANVAKRRRLGPAAHLRAEGLSRERTLVLTAEDAAEALQDAGVAVKPAPYYVDAAAPQQ